MTLGAFVCVCQCVCVQFLVALFHTDESGQHLGAVVCVCVAVG